MKIKQKKFIAILLAIIFALSISVIAVVFAIRAIRSPERLILRIEDVSQDDWFYRYVLAGLRFGLIDVRGGDFHFEPDRRVTQGEFIAMLGRLHEYGNRTIRSQRGSGHNRRYINWALERGIIYYDDYWEVMPNAFITREQMAVIVYRYINVFELHDYFRSEYFIITWMGFSDSSRFSNWSREPVRRLVHKFIIADRGSNNFMPRDAATHADVLQILTRVGSAVYDFVHPLR